MYSCEFAFELSRERLARAEQRATLTSRLGELPKGRPLFAFRRQVVALPGEVVVRRGSGNAWIERQRFEVSATRR